MLRLDIIGADDAWVWTLYGKNGKPICKSIKDFKTRDTCIKSADRFERNALRFGVKKNY